MIAKVLGRVDGFLDNEYKIEEMRETENGLEGTGNFYDAVLMKSNGRDRFFPTTEIIINVKSLKGHGWNSYIAKVTKSRKYN